MSSVVQSNLANQEERVVSASYLLLRHRQKLIEDLWESVLRTERGQEMLDLLKQMRSLSSAEGQVTETFPESTVPQLIEKLNINDAIQAARAFALYFQLTNIVEQHYESREQKLAQRITHTNSSSATGSPKSDDVILAFGNGNNTQIAKLEDSWIEPSISSSNKAGLFHWLFPYLKEINMPPLMLQRCVILFAKNSDVFLKF